MDVSFQVTEEGTRHQYAMPKVPPPDDIDDMMKVRARYKTDKRFHAGWRKMAAVGESMPFTMELRRVTPPDMDTWLVPQLPRQYMWMRVKGRLSNDRALHHCALAYMSDWALLETSALAAGTHWGLQGKDGGTKIQPASIDHAMWFHHSFRADEWLLYECESPAASGGRGFNLGRFYTRDGLLVVSTAQEGLIRVKDWTGLPREIVEYPNVGNAQLTNPEIDTSAHIFKPNSESIQSPRSKL